jgi:predicted AlkP superfamily phosphohydrolase/phosphomutase
LSADPDKLLVIGMDAADRRLIRQWATEGHLPTLAGLLDSGVTAAVATPRAVLEGATWPTLLTSSSPAAHGMFSFLQLQPGTYDAPMAMFADRLPVPPFWAHLGRAGKRVAVVDVPFARPVRGLNGIQVTNWGSHDSWSWRRASWPPRLIRDIVARFGDYPVPYCDAPARTLADYADLRARLLAGVERKTAVLRHCLALEDWDFFFGVFSESHCAGHQLWHLMDPGHPWHDPAAGDALRSAIRDVYQALDAGLRTLLEGLPSRSHVVVLLSHGMGPYYAGSHLLPTILERLGVNPAGVDGMPESDSFRIRGVRGALWGARRFVPARIRRTLKTWAADRVAALWDWMHPVVNLWTPGMRAFAIPTNNMTGAIRINLKGREPMGLVKPGTEYEALCREIAAALRELINVDTGRPAVQWVARARELYEGPRLAAMPDLFVEWDHSAPIMALTSPQIGTVQGVLREDRTGDHRHGGLLIGRGARFGCGDVAATINTVDVAPTLLEFFGVPPPREYEGKSALQLLAAGGARPTVTSRPA